MRVLSIHAGADTGGCSWGLAGAFARADGPIQLDSCIRSSNYIDYPAATPWSEAGRLWDAADVVHLHNTMRTRELMTNRWGHPPKPFVLHHHGTHYRENHERLNRDLRRLGKRNEARTVVATLDLLQQGPGIPWAPAAHDLEALAKHRKRVPGTIGQRPIRIGHAPTNRAIKSTEAFLAACEKLAETHPVEVVLIEGKTWAECLATKGTVDVYFDQVLLGYGNNAIEAWGMGIPVVCGAEDFTLAEMERRFGRLPFLLADEGTIYAALLDMCDAKVRGEYARRGKAHAKRWHDGTETVRVLSDVYADLAG